MMSPWGILWAGLGWCLLALLALLVLVIVCAVVVAVVRALRRPRRAVVEIMSSDADRAGESWSGFRPDRLQEFEKRTKEEK